MIIIQNSAAPHYLPWCIQKCIILTQSTALLFMSRIWRLTWWSRTKSKIFSLEIVTSGTFINSCFVWCIVNIKQWVDLAYNHSNCNPDNGTCIRNLSSLGRQPFYSMGGMGVLSFLLVALNWLHSIFAFAHNIIKIKSTLFVVMIVK